MSKNNYGYRIYDKRRPLGKTQAELGKALGLTQTVVSKIENRTMIPNMSILIEISNQLALRFMISKDGISCYDDVDIVPGILK